MSNLVTLMQQIKEEGTKLGFDVVVHVHASTNYASTPQVEATPTVEVEVTSVVEEPVAEKPAPKKRTRKPAAKKPVVEEVVEYDEEDEEVVVEDKDEELTIDILIPLVKKAIAEHGKVAVKSLLEEFGIAKLSELDKQYYAEFKERLEEECP